MNPLSKFDIDLQYGQQGENWLRWLGTDQATVEVKTERDAWATTGNVVFEYECRSKPSGIAVTQADYWCHILRLGDQPQATYLWRTEDLKVFLRKCITMPGHAGSRLTTGGDANASKVILVPIPSLYLIACETLPMATRAMMKD